MQNCIHPSGEMHTPYGATEALPVASIGANEVLNETSRRTDAGSGVCVGRRFPGIEWRVIRIVDGPIHSIADAVEMPEGELGELIVRGPVVTDRYVTRVEANALAKIADGDGDLASDGRRRLSRPTWAILVLRATYSARASRPPARCTRSPAKRFSIGIRRCGDRRSSAVGPPGEQQPVDRRRIAKRPCAARCCPQARVIDELRSLALSSPLTAEIRQFLVHPSLPVDLRHNVKINREKLAVWAARRIVESSKSETISNLKFEISNSRDKSCQLGVLGVLAAFKTESHLMHALVTGAGGFLGRYIVEQLVAQRRSRAGTMPPWQPRVGAVGSRGGRL